MNLRVAPNADAEKLKLLKVNRYNDQFYHLMKMTGKYDGHWAEVEVTMWKSMDDFCRKTKDMPQKIIGWIKYLDDKGFPNVFDIPTPCC